MKVKPNGTPSQMAKTGAYWPPGFWPIRMVGTVLVSIALLFLAIGVFGSRIIWPRTVEVPMAQKPNSVKQEVSPAKKFNAKDWELEINLEAERLTEEKINQRLENSLGVLIIEDNEAQTVINKQAAVGDKRGNTALRKGTVYKVHNYRVFQEVGRGIASDARKNLFYMEWRSGLTKPPDTIPGHIHVISGKNIGLGKPTSP